MAVLCYHGGDTFENTDSRGRITFYGITGYPTAKIDGKRQCVGGGSGTFNCFLGAYNMEMYAPGVNISPCTLRVDVLYDSTSRLLKAKAWVTALDTFTHANAHLRYAITESHKYYHWQTQDSLQHIVRKMLPNYDGVVIPALSIGQTFVDSQSYTVDPSWVAKNCEMVFFVQADAYTADPVFRVTKAGLFPTYVFGDADRDGIVGVGDVLYEINYLYKGGPCPNPYGRGDVDRSCIIDVNDVMYLINFLYKGGQPPMKGCD